MESLASVWGRDPGDLNDIGGNQHEPLPEWDSNFVFNTTAPPGLTWTEQLSPHLQRNKQLQDTLQQREEELARLQEENNKLREFLNSSFVKNLEQKAKKLTANGRKRLKRNLTYLNDFCGNQRVASQEVSKKVCRNLTAEFCSESFETSACSEPNLDLWVLRTLGLKDRDTIDTSDESLSEHSLRSLVYDTAITPSLSPGYNLNSSFSPPVAMPVPPSVHSYHQSASHETNYKCSAAEYHAAKCANPSESSRNCPALNCPADFTATGVTGHYKIPEALTKTYNKPTAFQSDTAEICPLTALSQVQTLEGNQAKHQVYWSPLQENQMPSHDLIRFSPPAERMLSSFVSSSSPTQPWMPASGCSPMSPSAPSQPAATLHMPCNRTDLAFSMSLSPSNSVKTHSFPQGQAFVRKDTEGRWNFTWVPRQGP